MDPKPLQSPQAYTIDLLTDPACAKDMIKGILHSIFFQRTFTPIRPLTRDILDTTLMVVDDPDLETIIDARATAAVRRLESASNNLAYNPSNANPSPIQRVTIHISLTERRRKNKQGYFTFSLSKPVDEEFVWETWAVSVQMFRARSEGEAERLRRRMEKSLREAAFRIIELAGGEKDHIPPITTADANPFPYRIVVGEVG